MEPGGSHLRRRMHILERARSYDMNPDFNSEDHSLGPLHNLVKPNHGEEHEPTSNTEYETGSQSSEEELVASSPSETHKPDFASHHSPGRRSSLRDTSFQSDNEPSSSTSSTSWYEFDLSVVVALVAPIGNWLTGGDHVKNLLLLLLLIFYLHQIIEIPWALYNTARPRRRSSQIPLTEIPDSEDRYKQIASSELHSLQIFYLSLTVVSPLVGALILKLVTSSVSGTHAVSWFSTTLFVLATGIRPWKHLIHRLRQRTLDLHDVIHYPSSSAATTQTDLEALKERLVELEKGLANMKTRLATSTEEVYDHVDDAIDAVEKTMRRHERKCDANRDAQETRIERTEAAVEDIRRERPANPRVNVTQLQPPPRQSVLSSLLTSFTPAFFLPAPPPQARSPIQLHSPIHPSRSFNSSPRLETIPEDADFNVPTQLTPANPLPALASQYHLPGVNLVLRCGDLATLPVRTVLHYLLDPPSYSPRRMRSY